MKDFPLVFAFWDTLISMGKQQGYDPYEVEMRLRMVPDNVFEHWVDDSISDDEIDLGKVQKYLDRLMR